jgi:hypothetical protein
MIPTILIPALTHDVDAFPALILLIVFGITRSVVLYGGSKNYSQLYFAPDFLILFEF